MTRHDAAGAPPKRDQPPTDWPLAIWLVAVALACLLGAVAAPASSGVALVLLVLAIAPIVVDLALRGRVGGDLARLATFAGWSAAAAGAIALGGPAFLTWMFTPIAAALGRWRDGGATAAATLAVLALGLLGLLGLAFSFPAWSGAAEGPLGWLAPAAGLAPAAAAAWRVSRDAEAEVRRQAHVLARQARLLGALVDPHVRLRTGGWVLETAGPQPAWLEALGPLRGRRLAEALTAEPGDQRKIDAILEDAASLGQASGVIWVPGEDALSLRAVGLTARALGEGEVVVAIADHTDARRAVMDAEARAEAAEAAARDRAAFVAGLAHELRTPLGAVLGFSDTMRARVFGPMPAKYGEYADHIFESAEHLLDLVNDLLDDAKLDAGRVELERTRFDAWEVLASASRMLEARAEAKGVALHTPTGVASLPVLADARAIKQIVVNLVANAIKFTPEGGRVTAGFSNAGADVILEVTDTGVGMTADEVAGLGEAFHQTESGRRAADAGTGLGLSVVRKLANLHGGDFTVDSTPGQGTRVRVRLPIRAGVDADPEPAPERRDARSQQDALEAATQRLTRAAADG